MGGGKSVTVVTIQYGERKSKTPRSGAFCLKSRRLLLHVRRDELCHLEHRDLALAAEDSLQLVVGEDIPLIRRILKVILLDVDPELLDHFSPRERTFADDRLQFRREVEWL